MKTSALIVYVTTATRKEADKIAQAIVEKRLAACVSILPEVYSRYWWKGRLEYDRELLLMVKTTTRRYKALEKLVRSIHSYEAPEILALPVAAGNPDYLKWLTRTAK